MPKKYIVNLTDQKQKTLQEIIKKGKNSTQMKRAYVLLSADISESSLAMSDQKIHETYRVSPQTIEQLRERFVLEG